jgi:hypothetical protein
MDDWQKDFWEVIETVALGIENFFQEVTQTIEEINEEIIIESGTVYSRGFTPGIRRIF